MSAGTASAGPRRGIFLVIHGAGRAGTERHVRGLLLELAARGANVQLVASEEGPLLRDARDAGLRTHLVRRRSTIEYIIHLKRLLEVERPVLVHAHSGRLPCLAARLAGVPGVVETRHGLPGRSSTIYRVAPRARRWEAWKCVLADRTVAVCEADARWLEDAGLGRSRLRVVPNGLGPARSELTGDQKCDLRARWGLPARGRLLGFVGRLAPEKAPERFLETLALVQAEDSWGVVCGGGPRDSKLRSLAATLGIAQRVIWLGERDLAEGLLPALDLLLLPSWREGMPYVLLEALQAGIPALCTPVGGVPEVLAGPVLGAGCRPWDAAGWAAWSTCMLEDATLRTNWSLAARARAAEFPEEKTVSAIAALYQEVLSRKASQGVLSGDGGRC